MLVFLAVAEAESYSTASRKLGLGQSVLSHHIDGFEKELGVSLFYKKGRNIALTSEGEILFREGKRLQKAAQKAEDAFSIESSLVARKINLAGDALTCSFTLPWILADFKDKYPDVNFTYKHLHPDDIVESVVSGDIDMALMGHLVNNKKLNAEACFYDDIILVGPPDCKGREIDVEQLVKLQLFWIASDPGLETVLRSSLQSVGVPVKDLNIFMEVEELPILKTFIRAGVGYAFVPRISVAEALESEMMAEIKVTGLEIKRTNYRVYKKSNQLRDIVCDFLEFVKEARWSNIDS